MGIRNGDRVMWMVPLNDDCIQPDYYFSFGAAVIDADPNATMVSVQVDDEPFFRRIPAWMLQVIQ